MYNYRSMKQEINISPVDLNDSQMNFIKRNMHTVVFGPIFNEVNGSTIVPLFAQLAIREYQGEFNELMDGEQKGDRVKVFVEKIIRFAKEKISILHSKPEVLEHYGGNIENRHIPNPNGDAKEQEKFKKLAIQTAALSMIMYHVSVCEKSTAALTQVTADLHNRALGLNVDNLPTKISEHSIGAYMTEAVFLASLGRDVWSYKDHNLNSNTSKENN